MGLLSSSPTRLRGDAWYHKLTLLPWSFVLLLFSLGFLGVMALYSAGGGFTPWAAQHLVRLVFGICVMIAVAMVDIRIWYRLALPLYLGGLVLLGFVDMFGKIGGGARSWINLGFMTFQPSELMKILLVLLLARIYHDMPYEKLRKLRSLIMPMIVIAIPTLLVAVQPDLGTASKMAVAGIAVIFVAGPPLWIFITGACVALGSLPILWSQLYDYQKRRVLTFLDPESDPFGAGFHITQSKIALGSGGFWGKGFLEGTQSRLNFLPEKHTDFIFTLWAEEWGWIGGTFIMLLYYLVFAASLWYAFRCRHMFGKLLSFGIAINLGLYVMINIGMVMGLLPVVGVPLPFMSHGGTAILTNLFGFGLLLSAVVYRDSKLPTH